MLTPEQREQHITKLERVPSQLEAVVTGLDDDQLDTSYGEGKWTIRQVCHHLADSHLVGVARVRLMITEDTPTLITYEQDRWAQLSDSTSMPVSESISILHGLHARWVFLLRDLTEADWSRTGYHPERGNLTIEDMLTIYSGHGGNHMKSIRALRESRGW